MIKQKLATLCLMIAMFLSPIGFDAIQMVLIELTGSLLRANFVMYCLAALFFGLYFYLSGSNPLKEIKKTTKGFYIRLRDIFSTFN